MIKEQMPENIGELKKLIERYETITLKEIENVWTEMSHYYDPMKPAYLVSRKLTGFGTTITCNVCQAVMDDKDEPHCGKCVCGKQLKDCLLYPHNKTYKKIIQAKTPEKLLVAYRKRGEHLKKYFKDFIK